MRYIGEINGNGLYAEWDDEHNQIIFNFDGENIAAYNVEYAKIVEDPIAFRENTAQNELSAEIKDKIEQYIETVNIEELQRDREKDREGYRESLARAIGVESRKIRSITEVDLDEKVEDKDKEESNQDEREQEDERKKEEHATTKDIDIKQELKLSSMATSMKTIGGVLERAGKMPKVEGKTFAKLGIVEADRVKDIDKDAKTNTTRFSIVAIATDGTVVPLDLEQDYAEGNNPREINYRTNADGRVEQDDVNSRYKIGNDGETISIKFSNGPGNIEVGYSAHKTLGGNKIEGNESYDHQLETSTVYWRPRKDSRDQEFSGGNREAEERAEEINDERAHNEDQWKDGQKGKPKKESDDYKDTDGDKETKDSNHQNDLIERARKLRSEYPEVGDVFSEEEIVKRFEKAHDNGKQIDEEEKDIKEDASRLPKRNR